MIKFPTDTLAKTVLANLDKFLIADSEDGDELKDLTYEDLRTNLGFVDGPASAVNNNIATFDLTTGKVIKDSGYKLDDAGINATSLWSAFQIIAQLATKVTGSNSQLPTQAENNAMVGTSGDPSSTNKYVTENDTSNGATKTATTISFTAPSTISDSGSGFVTANFRVGNSITISGSASNNGTFTILTVSAGSMTVSEAIVTEGAGASVSIAAVNTNKIVRRDSNGLIPGLGNSEFGSGSDGSVTFDGSTTILGMVPAGNIYTMTRDIYCTNITINNGVTIKPAGYRIFATGTLTNNGIISNNGGNGGNATNSSASTVGAVGSAGSAPATGVTVFSSGGAGTAGALGKTTNGSGNGASSPTSTTNSVASGGGTGGTGGGVENGGGTGGSSTATTAGTNGLKDVFLASFMYTPAGVIKAGTAGGGGGGGGNYTPSSIGTGAGGSGGGGGGAGGVIFISSALLSGNGSIQATGGNGGNGGNSFLGTATGVRLGGGGGGGGGAGGVVIIITKTTTNPFTINVSGGTGGTGGTGVKEGVSGSTADGASGASGSSGVSAYFTV